MPPNVSISMLPASGAGTRRSWHESRIEHHIAARKAFGAYVAVTTDVRATDLRRSQEFARQVRRFLARRS